MANIGAGLTVFENPARKQPAAFVEPKDHSIYKSISGAVSTVVRGGGERLGIKSKLDVLTVTLVATVMMVILGLIYFFLTLLIVKVASDVLFDDTLTANMGALAAALVTAAVIISGALEKKRD